MLKKGRVTEHNLVTPLSGSWLFLRGLDQLPAAVLQTAFDLLTEVQRARETQATALHWRGETIRVTHDNPSACFASVLVHPERSFPQLPSSVSQSFKTCSVPCPDIRLILKALFHVHEFENAVHLAKQLNILYDAVTELFGQNFAALADQNNTETETESAKSREERLAAYCCPPGTDLPPRPPLGLRLLKGVVSLAQRHMQEFDALGLMETGEGGGALHALSTVYSEISESTRASLKFRSTLTQVSIYRLLSIIYCLSSIVLSSLSIIYCLSSIVLSSIVYHLLSIIYCLIIYCLSSIVYHLLSIIYCLSSIGLASCLRKMTPAEVNLYFHPCTIPITTLTTFVFPSLPFPFALPPLLLSLFPFLLLPFLSLPPHIPLPLLSYRLLSMYVVRAWFLCTDCHPPPSPLSPSFSPDLW